MESGRKTLIISVIGIVVAIGLMVGVGFGVVRRFGQGIRHFDSGLSWRSAASAEEASHVEFDFTDFDSVYINGGWSLSITQGDAFSVAVEDSRGALHQIDVFTSRGTLHLEQDPGIRRIIGKLRVTLSMPDPGPPAHRWRDARHDERL